MNTTAEKCTQALNHPGLTVKVLEVGKVIQCRAEWKEFRERTHRAVIYYSSYH